MVSTHSPTIKLFAENYIAQLILGFFLAFALQQAVVAITNAEEFRAGEVWLAVEHAMNQKYSDYPRFDRLDGMNNGPKEEEPSLEYGDVNKSYKSINEAISSLGFIPVRSVGGDIVEKTDMDLWPDEQVRTIAKELITPSLENEELLALKETIENEELSTLKKTIVEKIEEYNETYRPKQYQIKESVREILKKHKSLRQIAATLLVCFLIIQPWHLYIALKQISHQNRSSCIIETSDTIDLSCLSPNKPIMLLSLALLIAVILTYAAINWGQAFTGSVLGGIFCFLIFWTLFDLLRIVDLCIRFRPFKKENLKAMFNAIKPHRNWLLKDISLFVGVGFILLSLHSQGIDSYEQMKKIRIYEIVVLILLVVINFRVFFKGVFKEKITAEGFDKYIHSLEKLSILSDEDETDAQIVAQEIEKTTGEKKWLDIGSGNLQKVFLIVKLLLKKGIHFRSIDCLEPRQIWKEHQPLEQLQAPLRIHQEWWPNFIKGQYSNHTWSMITLIHSLYQSKITERGLVQDLQDIKSHVSSLGCVIIITEGEGSSLLRVKRNVYKELGGSLVTEKTIIKTTNYLGWPSPERHVFDQKFIITSDDLSCAYDKRSAFPWFIFESATSTCDSLQSSVVRRTSMLLIRELKETRGGRTFLNVQDVALIYRF